MKSQGKTIFFRSGKSQWNWLHVREMWNSDKKSEEMSDFLKLNLTFKDFLFYSFTINFLKAFGWGKKIHKNVLEDLLPFLNFAWKMLQKLSSKMLERCPLQCSVVWKSCMCYPKYMANSPQLAVFECSYLLQHLIKKLKSPGLHWNYTSGLIARNFSPGWNFSLVALGNVNTPVKTSFYLHDKRFNPVSAYWAGIFSSRDCGPNKLQVTNPNQPVVLCNFRSLYL